MEVTTNHIAARSGISVGNIYYYYKNKEEIIRAIFQMIKAEGDEAMVLPDWDGKSLGPMVRVMELLFHFYEHYLFLFRDYDYILRKDPQMVLAFRELIEFRRKSFAPFLEAMIQKKMINNKNTLELEVVIQNVWLISNTWYSFAALLGITDRKVIASRGVIHSMLPLKSILSKKGCDHLDEILQSYWKQGFPGKEP